MTSDELKGTVSTILGQQHSAQLYLVLKVNDELVLRLADIEDESTAPEIQHMFEEFLETTIVASVTYVLDKSRLSIRLVPPYSEERLAAAREYAKEHGFQVIQTEEKIA